MQLKLTIFTLILLLGLVAPTVGTAASSAGPDSKDAPRPTEIEIAPGTERVSWAALEMAAGEVDQEDLVIYLQSEEATLFSTQVAFDDWCSDFAHDIYMSAYYSRYAELYQSNGGDWQAADAGAESYASGRRNQAERNCRAANEILGEPTLPSFWD